jgi:hypothetical protein
MRGEQEVGGREDHADQDADGDEVPGIPLSDRKPIRGVRGYLTVLSIIADRASMRNQACRWRSRYSGNWYHSSTKAK